MRKKSHQQETSGMASVSFHFNIGRRLYPGNIRTNLQDIVMYSVGALQLSKKLSPRVMVPPGLLPDSEPEHPRAGAAWRGHFPGIFFF